MKYSGFEQKYNKISKKIIDFYQKGEHNNLYRFISTMKKEKNVVYTFTSIDEPILNINDNFHTEMFASQKRKIAHGTKVIEVTPNALNDIIINIPSLEEQERIASVLESYEMLCGDIANGIPAEIEARQKQYEYYRDKLLSF